ncbi:hypothetical protein C8R46DRAFT_1037722 [Mycena filopes]|nr:hypothetical protein C8R46DRAFT_1037722 [Mycena filopes]
MSQRFFGNRPAVTGTRPRGRRRNDPAVTVTVASLQAAPPPRSNQLYRRVSEIEKAVDRAASKSPKRVKSGLGGNRRNKNQIDRLPPRAVGYARTLLSNTLEHLSYGAGLSWLGLYCSVDRNSV